MASRTSCLLSRSFNRRSQHFCDVCKYMFRMDQSIGSIINAQIVFSKCMPTVITASLCTKFLIDLAAPCCVCPTLHSSILVIIMELILQQSTMRAPFSKVMMICMTTMIVQIAMLLTIITIVCVISVTAMSHSPFSKVLVPMEIQRSSDRKSVV